VTPASGQYPVANGLAFDTEGDLFIIDTARGGVMEGRVQPAGRLISPTGCNSTFTANTLCLSNVAVAHPILEGGDGIMTARGTSGSTQTSAKARALPGVRYAAVSRFVVELPCAV